MVKLLICCDVFLALPMTAVESRNVRFTACCFKRLLVSLSLSRVKILHFWLQPACFKFEFFPAFNHTLLGPVTVFQTVSIFSIILLHFIFDLMFVTILNSLKIC